MILSQTTDVLFDTFGFEEGIRVAAEAGFDALDLNLIAAMFTDDFSEENYASTAERLVKLAKENGLFFNQAHAPFPTYILGNDEYNARVLPAIRRAIRAAGLVGAKQIVVHPFETRSDPTIDQKQYNIDFYNALIPDIKASGCKVALENMWGHPLTGDEAERRKIIVPNVCSLGKDLAEYFDALDPEYFTVCLDIGHSGLVGEAAADAIYALGGSRLHALHVHDNDNYHDSHTFPFMGAIDWKSVMKALRGIGYDGDFTFEIGGALLNAYKKRPELQRTLFRLMAQTGRELIAMADA